MKDKIPLYDIVNKFFVGAVFSILFIIVSIDKFPFVDIYNKYSDFLKDWSVIVSAIFLIAMYEIGFILERGSSTIVAPILEKTKIWPKEEYGIDISQIKESNKTFSAIITELVLIRTHILMYLLLTVEAIFCSKWILSVIFIVFIILFIFSGKKHNQRINKIRKDYANKNKERKDLYDTRDQTPN